MADKKYMDLGTRKGATAIIDFDQKPTRPFYVEVRDPKTQQRLYERGFDKERLYLNLPTASGKVCVIVVGEPKIRQYLVTDLERPNIPFDRVPTAQRPYKFTDFKLVANFELPGYARMWTDKPIIEYNPAKMAKLSEPLQRFITLHEMGHYYFDDELTTDRWTINRFLNDGYNMSAANYGLTHVLSAHPENVERMKAGDNYLREISKIYYNEPVTA